MYLSIIIYLYIHIYICLSIYLSISPLSLFIYSERCLFINIFMENANSSFVLLTVALHWISSTTDKAGIYVSWSASSLVGSQRAYQYMYEI